MAFYPMRSQAYSQDQRKVAVDNNRRTNFISQSDGGFEAPQKKFDFAGVPDKGKADTEQVNAMIDNLRKEHFRLGEQNTQYARTNNSYGAGSKSASKRETLPWAHLNTNYKLGTDAPHKATDYQNRFS